ncbi:transporter [Candidatus Endobugula sertula]|uniref:Transporter n=1 Tax=Candidatus Endobugula sertula TaxID=62101 RepID=A0A1D2QS26_9GAMM|nr:transporter [Candidatus Endobugula sertula]
MSVDVQHGQQGINGIWSSRWIFILAATGSAVGLGNLWKFPYVAGEHGGGAFVLVYVVCIALIGIPILLAEVMLGRRGRMSPINSMLYLAKESNVSRWWSCIGYTGVLAGLLTLSFYSVVAGWSLHYVVLSLTNKLYQISATDSKLVFNALLKDPWQLIFWHTVFMLLTISVVGAGVIKGLGRAISIMMPLLFILLFVLLGYSTFVGDFEAGWRFLFSFDTSKLTWASILDALGHAFFTLSVGMGVMIAYGAYMPEKKASLGRTVLAVTVLDTLIALMVGLAIFSIVFANPSIKLSSGPGLLFVSLPVAFGNMVMGQLFAVIFFLLVAIAALSSAISLIEPAVAWLVEYKGYKRYRLVFVLGFIIWCIGLGSVFSFNYWSELKLFGKTFFESLSFLTANILLPVGGLLTALFVGWRMDRDSVIDEVGDIQRGPYRWWFRVLRFVSPVLLMIVFLTSLW